MLDFMSKKTAKKPTNINKGRPTRYNKAIHPDIARKSGFLLGDKEKVADFLGISKTTFYKWEKSHREFKQAIDEAILQASSDIAKSLFDIAKGGFVKTTIKTRKYKIPKKNECDVTEDTKEDEIIEVTETSETLPPNYKAIEFWLRNKNNWKSSDAKEEGQAQGKNFIIMPSERFK